MLKRLVDIVVSLLTLCLLGPLLLAVSVAILASSGRPIFFRQIRVGRGGIPFTIFKFRTMALEGSSDRLATNGDPRIMPLGAALRRWKIDELPQLLNVLAGDMSVVGPRPELPRFVALYDEAQRRVLDVRPGLTDPAALKYRDEQALLSVSPDPERTYVELVMPDKLRLNLDYVAGNSLLTDAGIMARTAAALMGMR